MESLSFETPAAESRLITARALLSKTRKREAAAWPALLAAALCAASAILLAYTVISGPPVGFEPVVETKG
jgi:hypothetical protein